MSESKQTEVAPPKLRASAAGGHRGRGRGQDLVADHDGGGAQAADGAGPETAPKPDGHKVNADETQAEGFSRPNGA